jgi:hypothetical protein
MKKVLGIVSGIVGFMILQLFFFAVTRNLFGVFLLDILCLILLYLTGFLQCRQSLNHEIQSVIFHPRGRKKTIITEETINNFPEPVKRYLRYTRVTGKEIPEIVYLKQKGRIRKSQESPWIEFTAEEYYTIDPPAFIWIGKAYQYGLPLMQVRDKYIQSKGSIQLRPGAVFPLATYRGEKMDQGSMMRYLNEMVFWFPAALIQENITFEAIDDNTVIIHFKDCEQTASATLYFNKEGKLVNFSAPRYEMNRKSMETWETPVSEYNTFHGYRLTSKGNGTWKLKEGDFTYIEVELTHLDYSPHL